MWNVVDYWWRFLFSLQSFVNIESLILNPLLSCFFELLASSESTKTVVWSPIELFVILLIHQLSLQIIVHLVIEFLQLSLRKHLFPFLRRNLEGSIWDIAFIELLVHLFQIWTILDFSFQNLQVFLYRLIWITVNLHH